MGFLLTLVRGGKGVFPCWSSLFLLPNLGVEEGCLGRKACSTSLHVDEDESVLGEEVAIMFAINVLVRSGVDCLNGEPGVTAVEGRVVIDAGLLRELRREKMRRMTKGMKILFFKFC